MKLMIIIKFYNILWSSKELKIKNRYRNRLKENMVQLKLKKSIKINSHMKARFRLLALLKIVNKVNQGQ